jgi:hypothetical protein
MRHCQMMVLLSYLKISRKVKLLRKLTNIIVFHLQHCQMMVLSMDGREKPKLFICFGKLIFVLFFDQIFIKFKSAVSYEEVSNYYHY